MTNHHGDFIWYELITPDPDGAASHVRAHGGTIIVEPMQIPGGDYAMNAIDPQGAHFALVGPRKG